MHVESAAVANYPRSDAGGGPQCEPPGAWGGAKHQLGGVVRVGEGQQRRRDVLVGELVVCAAGRLGHPALGGEHGMAGGGRAARPGGVHREQIPAGPGGNPGRPADESLAFRATAKRDHHPLPGLTAAGIAAAVKVPTRAAGQRGGQPQQGKLAQCRQVPRLEPAAQRRLHLVCRVDVAAGQPVPQGLWRRVHQLDLARGADDRIGHSLPRRGAGDLRHHVGEGIQVPHTDGGDHVDSRRKQVLDVLPSRAVARAGRVAVREIVYQRHRGAAGQHRAEVHLLGQRAPVWDFGGGNDLKTCQEVFGVRPAVCFRARHHHVGAVLRAQAALAEQRAGGAGTGCVAQVDPQTPAGGRSLGPGVSPHCASPPCTRPDGTGGMAAAASWRARAGSILTGYPAG